jgi:hypothetical protein
VLIVFYSSTTNNRSKSWRVRQPHNIQVAAEFSGIDHQLLKSRLDEASLDLHPRSTTFHYNFCINAACPQVFDEQLHERTIGEVFERGGFKKEPPSLNVSNPVQIYKRVMYKEVHVYCLFVNALSLTPSY